MGCFSSHSQENAIDNSKIVQLEFHQGISLEFSWSSLAYLSLNKPIPDALSTELAEKLWLHWEKSGNQSRNIC